MREDFPQVSMFPLSWPADVADGASSVCVADLALRQPRHLCTGEQNIRSVRQGTEEEKRRAWKGEGEARSRTFLPSSNFSCYYCCSFSLLLLFAPSCQCSCCCTLFPACTLQMTSSQKDHSSVCKLSPFRFENERERTRERIS